MYIAQTTTSNNDKLIAAVVTSVLLMGAYLTLQWTGLPAVKQNTETYEEINWTRFKPRPEKIMPKPEPVKPNRVEEPVKFEPPSKPAPAAKIDLNALKTQMTSLSQSTQALKQKKMSSQHSASQQENPGKLRLQKSSVLSGLNTLLGESSQQLSVTNRGRKGRAGGTASALQIGSGSSLESGRKRDFSGGGLALGAPKGKSNSSGAVEIGMVDPAQLGGDFDDLSPIYRALLEWMRSHPSRFQEVVNRFMEKNPGDLTSKVTFQMEGREFDMYLLCKEQLYEVRICLVEGNESTYLIDRGFKENSRFLRFGAANRTPTGGILSFSTSRKAASNLRSQEFYQVFLSWWESVK